MGIITKQIVVAGSKLQRQCEVLFDTGALACFVREAIASQLGQILKAPYPLVFKLGNNIVMRSEKSTVLFLALKGHPEFQLQLDFNLHVKTDWH